MAPELQGFVPIFRATHGMFHKALEGLTEAQARERNGGANPILWIAAHVVSVRSSFLRGFGGSVEIPWAKQFPRGGRLEDVTEWPTLAEVKRAWDEVHPAFMARLEAMSSEALAAETPIPSLSGTLLGCVGLAAVHDAYHVGQLGMARRSHGLERIVG